jgi:golgi-specific brefeldin A-resistance guanine nucleotide exchange factor 1
LKSLLFSLLTVLPEETSPRVIVVKPDLPTPAPVRPNGTKSRQAIPAYDPSVLFVLEFAAGLALRDAETVEAMGKDVGDALTGVVRDAVNFHPIVVSRALYYLLNLLLKSNVSCRLSVL